VNKSILLFLGATLMAPLAAQAQDAGGYEVQESVTFSKNSSKLSDAAQGKLRADVESLSVLLRYRPESSIEIAGYAESGEKKPGPLADARAQQVWQFLIANGLPAERMEPVGYGAKGKPSSRVDIRITSEDAVAMTQLAQPLPSPSTGATSAPSTEAPVAVAPPAMSEPAAPPVAKAPPASNYTPPQESERYSAPPPVASAPAEPAIEPTPGHEESWSKSKVPPSTPASRAAEQKRLKAEQAAAAAEKRRAEQEAAAEKRRAEQAAALERKQAAEEARKQQAAEALERKQAAAELKKQQAAEALERKQAAVELKKQQAAEALERKQAAAEAKRQEAMRLAMSQPPPALTPEAKETTLKTDKGVKIVDNQIAPSYTKPQQAATPKSALPGEGNYFIQGTAYFSANARTLTPGSSATIDALAVRVQKLLQARPNLRIDVVGHADPITESSQADVLAEGRAEELVKELSARGVDSAHLHAAGAADTQPLTSKRDDPARNLNMRAEIRVPN